MGMIWATLTGLDPAWLAGAALTGLGLTVLSLLVLMRLGRNWRRRHQAITLDLQRARADAGHRQRVAECLRLAVDSPEHGPEIEQLFQALCQAEGLEWAALLVGGAYSSAWTHLTTPRPFLTEEGVRRAARQMRHPEEGPLDLDRTEWQDAVAGRPDGSLSRLLIVPLALPPGSVGGMVGLCAPGSRNDRADALGRAGRYLAGVLSFRRHRADAEARVAEAEQMLDFITQLATFAETGKVLDSLHRYFSASYPNLNVAILLVDEQQGHSVKRGHLQEPELAGALLQQACQRADGGDRVLYLPDRQALLDRCPALGPGVVEAVLLVPLVAFQRSLGFLVFESNQARPIAPMELRGLTRLAEVSSHVLRYLATFLTTIERQAADAERLRLELNHRDSAIQALERERARDRLCAHGLSPGRETWGSLTRVRGMVEWIRAGVQENAPHAYDSSHFRRCVDELAALEWGLHRLELMHAALDPDVPVRPQEIPAQAFLEEALQAAARRIGGDPPALELSANLPADLTVRVDASLTAQAVSWFMDRVSSLAADHGWPRLILCQREGLPQLMLKYSGSADADTRTNPDDVEGAIGYVVLARVIALQGGKLELERFVDHGFLIRLTLPTETTDREGALGQLAN